MAVNEFLVMWVSIVDADSPKEAALVARKQQREDQHEYRYWVKDYQEDWASQFYDCVEVSDDGVSE